jgi:hypothetical protein
MTVKTTLSLPEPFAAIPRHPLLFGPSPIHHLPVSFSSRSIRDRCIVLPLDYPPDTEMALSLKRSHSRPITLKAITYVIPTNLPTLPPARSPLTLHPEHFRRPTPHYPNLRQTRRPQLPHRLRRQQNPQTRIPNPGRPLPILRHARLHRRRPVQPHPPSCRRGRQPGPEVQTRTREMGGLGG